MKQLFCMAVFLVPLLLSSSTWALEPYLQVGIGAYSRDIVEEDPAISGFKFKGTADSTRLIVKAGLEIGDILNVYAQGGGTDLSIDEFDNYDASMKGLYGGGLRVNLYQAPYRDGLKLFVEGNYLRFSTDDHVQIQRCFSGCDTSSPVFLPTIAKETIQWNEYTVLLGASGRYFDIGPYGGVRLSWVDGKDRTRTSPDSNFPSGFRVNADVKEQDNFGLFFGADFFLDPSERTALNIEVSLIDQDSIQAAIRRSF
jgi:hypothetical protein